MADDRSNVLACDSFPFIVNPAPRRWVSQALDPTG
jgi:hypothetical protein